MSPNMMTCAVEKKGEVPLKKLGTLKLPGYSEKRGNQNALRELGETCAGEREGACEQAVRKELGGQVL